MWTLFLLLFLVGNFGFTDSGQVCASCSGMVDQVSCQHHVTCEDYENCYMRKYRTESGADLVDMECMASTVCPHSSSAIVGKRGEGHHVVCEACCNNASMCNQMISCEAVQIKECLFSWAQIGNTCYKVLVGQMKTFTEAIASCKKEGGKLAEPQANASFELLRHYMVDHYNAYSYWIGLSDVATETQFVWASNGAVAIYGAWVLGQPNGGRDDCVAIDQGRVLLTYIFAKTL